MMRHLLIAFAAATVVGATMIPDEAFARRGGGGGARGFHGGAVGARGAHRGAVAGRGYGYRGHPVARGAAWGAAGAAAVGAGAYYGNGYNNSCYRDSYGQVICPQQNQYQYQY
jgi:hypothetical protein